MFVQEKTPQSVIDSLVSSRPGASPHRLVIAGDLSGLLGPALSKQSLTGERFIHVPPLILDRQKRLITLTTKPSLVVDLTRGEAAILACLMLSPNRVVSCRDLVTQALGYESAEDDPESLIRPYIFRLRRKIETNPKTPQLICTVRGKGYQFASL